ncbi:MAG: hypothetical protein C0506_03030 [Anaerolinea sp.]|nr:hypothetical protein [Anaerolinea sp.]
MTSRVEEATFPVRAPRSRSRVRARPSLSASQRILFVFSLLTFGLASMYTGVVSLARVYPALFPGQSLINIPVLAQLDRLPIGISAPDEGSIFNQRINLLVLGIDKRPQYEFRDQDGYLTDTIMVATIDPLQKTVSLLSFPRDMQIDINLPNGFKYEDRINTSYGVGVREGKKPEAGIKQLQTDLKANFGIEIDHWVVMDFKGVEKLIDAVGGVEVDIPYDLSVPNWFYSDDDINGVWLSFPAGINKLDGYHAVAFGRHREYDSDLKRVKRQQLVVKAALDKAFQLGLLNNPLELWDAYSSTVKTDIPRSKMPGYGLLLKETNGRLKTYSLGDPVNGIETLTGYTTGGGAAVQLWNHENVQYILSQVFTKAKYSQSNVEIQNGYGGDEGAVRAGALGRYLAYSKGLPTVYYGPDQPVQPETTVTLYGNRFRPLAEDIAKWMNIPESQIKELPRGDGSLPDVVIIIGKDFKIPGT